MNHVTGASKLEAGCAGIRCRARSRGGEPERVGAQSRLCSSCRSDAARDLRALPGLHEECALALSGSTERQVRTSTGGAAPSMPFNANAAEARRTVVDVLGSWAAMVAEERRVRAPRPDPAGLAAFLGRHLDWLAAHPAAAEFSDEMARLVRTAHHAAYATASRQVGLGRCVEPGCAGELVATLRPGERSRPAEIVCRADPAHRWGDNQWLDLNRRMTARTPTSQTAHLPNEPRTAPAQAARWFTVAEVAQLWRVASGTVYRLASEDRWQRRTRNGRAFYLESDVSRTFARRAQGSATVVCVE
ncbi:hypothetical protein [Krasilnikovia sp. MM14-A1004]|uniref:hypothetical protein n=1 Tax=Krasilnikovia sp. MM14-A1004 TaxID=3373541 RepID=UPI00399C6495